MTIWTIVTPSTSSYSPPIGEDGYSVIGYMQVDYVSGASQWTVVSSVSSSWTAA